MNDTIVPVATGDIWLGSGVRSSSSVIRELILKTEKEVILTAYLLTNLEIVSHLEKILDRGVKVIIYLYNDDISPSRPSALLKLYDLEKNYPYLSIIPVETTILHAKVIISDGTRMYCGSANLSESGMNRNYELGFLLEEPVIACKIRDLLHRLDAS